MVCLSLFAPPQLLSPCSSLIRLFKIPCLSLTRCSYCQVSAIRKEVDKTKADEAGLLERLAEESKVCMSRR